MSKRKRWVCPDCNTGRLLPSRLAPLDVRRFCLPCSAKKERGPLVARVCPPLDKERAQRAAKRAEKAKKERAKSRAKSVARRTRAGSQFIIVGVDLRVELKRIYEVCDPAGALPYFSCTMGYKSWHGQVTGMAWGSYRLHLTVGRSATAAEAVSVLLHEVAHHNIEWKECYVDLARRVYGCDVGTIGNLHRITDNVTEELKRLHPRLRGGLK